MKPHKIIASIGVFIFFISITISVAGQTASPSARPTSITPTTVEEKQIEVIKEKIADKVAELRKRSNKAYAGTVSAIKANVFTIKSRDDSEYQVEIDEKLTKFYQVSGTSKKDLKQDDIEKFNYIIVTGPLNDKVIKANVIYKDEEFFVKTGKVTEVNADDRSLSVITSEKDTLTLDLETSTTLQLMDVKTLNTAAGTISKVKEGDTIHFVYKKTGEETQANNFTAEKILILPQEYFVK